ncbi:hypothetical protein CRM22_003221 [Opisthorchis felineus]|nr:hypothetical protein CRM22_003221 [Opisthorchis felineus]
MMLHKYISHFFPDTRPSQMAAVRASHKRLSKPSMTTERSAVISISQKCLVAQFCLEKETENLRQLIEESEKEFENGNIILTLFAERAMDLQKSKHTFQKMVFEQEPYTFEILQRYFKLMCRRWDAIESKLRLNSTDQRNKLRDLRGKVESIRGLDEGAELIDIEYARVLNRLRRGVLNELYAKILRRKGELGTLVNHLRIHSTELNRCVKELAATSSLTERRYLLTSEASGLLKLNAQQLRRLRKMSHQIHTTQSQYKVPAPRQLIDVYTENRSLTKALPVAQNRLMMSRELFKKHKKIWADISGSKR